MTLLALPVQAEIMKCLGSGGEVTYRDRPCHTNERRGKVERDYTNELPLALPPEEAEKLQRAIREGRARKARRIQRRNAAIRAFAREHEARQAQCEEYKEDYRAMLRFKRRNGSPGRDYESHVIRRMREACSD